MTTLSLLFLFAAGPAPEVRIEPAADPTRVRVVAKLPADLAGRLPQGKLTPEQGEPRLRLAVVNDESGQEGVAMLGAYERRDRELVFTPRFALLHGHRYRATFDPAE